MRVRFYACTFAAESLMMQPEEGEEDETTDAFTAPAGEAPSGELTAEQLKEHLEHLRPEDFGKFNL